MIMQIGIDSFAAAISDPATGLTLSPVERMHLSLAKIIAVTMLQEPRLGVGRSFGELQPQRKPTTRIGLH
jgi:hypothetical protein